MKGLLLSLCETFVTDIESNCPAEGEGVINFFSIMMKFHLILSTLLTTIHLSKDSNIK